MKEKYYNVAKTNELIRNTRNTFTTTQQKMVLYVISKITPEHEELKLVFNIKDFYSLLGKGKGQDYQRAKKALIDIRNKGFWLNVGGKKIVTTAIFDRVEIEEESGAVGIEIHKNLYPHLLKLQTFTSYQLVNVLNLSKKYAIELYEVFRSYLHANSNTHKVTLSVDYLRKRLGVHEMKTYKNTNKFKEKILDRMIDEEINPKTDITVTYKPKRTGRYVTHYIFDIKFEIGYYDEPEFETLDHHNPDQLTMEELLKRGHQAEEGEI